MEIHVTGVEPQSKRHTLAPTHTGRLAQFALARQGRIDTQQYSRFEHLRPAAPIDTHLFLEQREETAGMQETRPQQVVNPPSGEDPFKRLRELGGKLAEGFRRRFASTSGDVAQEAQSDTDEPGALEVTAKRPAITATQAAEPAQPAQAPVDAAPAEPVLDQDAAPEEDGYLAVTAPRKAVKVSRLGSAFARMKSMGAQAFESFRAGLSQPQVDAEGVDPVYPPAEPAEAEEVVAGDIEDAQTAASEADTEQEITQRLDSDRTQRLTPAERARRASQPNSLNVLTQPLKGRNGTLYMQAVQSAPGAQMQVGVTPADESGFHVAPTTQHAISQPLAPVQPEKTTWRQKWEDAKRRMQEGFNEGMTK